MANYEGMRWFKCDLQMQTPADAPHWRGQAMADTEEGQQAAAEAYIRRCYEVGLEVIAITDHNFLSRKFIPYLQKAIDNLIGEYGYRITIFPGFEFEADVGKGIHVLALFEPTANLDEIDHALTECGVAYPRVQGGVLAKSTKRLPEILQVTQKLDANGVQKGLVILPHVLRGDGLFDNNKVGEWLQQTEYLNPDLLAVEVPKPVSEMSAGWQRLFAAGEDCENAWRRSRPIACIMSSDTKALTPEEDANNYIGMRHTWIKMSKPSIESLRQAFLDHASRVRLQDERPSDSEDHPRVLSVRVKGAAFLEDQEVIFSPNLNCIIGGRGSGKSSLLEYLRFALETEQDDSLPEDIKDKHDGIYRTIEGASAEVHVTFETQLGVTDTVVIRPHANEHNIEGREVIDLKTVLDQLQVQIFSQGELSRLTKPGHNQVLRLVNAASNDELLPLLHEETSLKSELEHLAVAGHRAKAVEAEVSRITQELQELTRQWQARKDVQGEAQAHQRARQAIGFVEESIKGADTDAKSLADLAATVVAPSTRLDGEQAAEWPHPEWFSSVNKAIEAARAELESDVKKASEKFTTTVLKLFSEASEWPAIKAELQALQDRFLQACQEKGLQPSDVTRLQEVDKQRGVKQTDLETKRKQLDELKKQVSSRADKLAALHAIWRKQFEVRRRACEAIQAGSHATFIDIEYMRDKASFDATWERLDPKDNRTRLGKNWGDIGKDLFAAHVLHAHIPSPWELIERWRSAPDEIPDDTSLQMFFDELVKYLDSDDVRSTWESVRLTRVDDFIDVELRRQDGTSAGRMSGAGGKLLSEGQRNTALLNLMLAQGKGPIVIDQPEDELDSNYIFSDLVPLLREVKEKRQLILATHNANLPVNADAELIYAIEARDAQGKKRSEGGLDRAEVTQAVLDIMEGSEQAFKRRSEKYHF